LLASQSFTDLSNDAVARYRASGENAQWLICSRGRRCTERSADGRHAQMPHARRLQLARAPPRRKALGDRCDLAAVALALQGTEGAAFVDDHGACER
jgi:hypothetical protein